MNAEDAADRRDDPGPRPDHSAGWYLDQVLADVERFAEVIDAGHGSSPVAACPGWDVLRLAEHLGSVHRWARFCAEHGRVPTEDDPPPTPFDPAAAADWLRAGAQDLCRVLGAADPEAPTWHPFPVERTMRVWPRRQAHETAMHRWDAERAAGRSPHLEPALASDGIDEYFELVIPRLVAREQIELPAGSFHVHCTDVEGEWLVWTDDGAYRMIRAHQKGDAALRGPAAELLLRIWGRESDGADALGPVGDEAVLDAWLSVGGM